MGHVPMPEVPPAEVRPSGPTEQEALRQAAWEIGERRPADSYQPQVNCVGLAMVHPTQGFAFWRLLPSWVDDKARSRGHGWHNSRPILRLYDVSYIEFNGLNAHRIQDEPLEGLAGERFFNLGAPGTWQIGEVGFLLTNGEFIPAARTPVVPFAPDAPSRRREHTALFVTAPGRAEQVGDIWDQEGQLRERRKPHLRHPLRIASFAFASLASGQEGNLATFVTELARGKAAQGHEPHVFVPASPSLSSSRVEAGVHYHPLPGVEGANAVELARSFAEQAGRALEKMPPFDLVHLHEWMTALGPWADNRPTVLSLGSLEATRRGDNPPDDASREIEKLEALAATRAGCVLVPGWLRDRAASELQVAPGRLHAFAMEGRTANEWESPLDTGQVKMQFGVGPMDRMVLYVGPLEHAAGVDLLVEALPVLLRRWDNLRLAFVGNGPMRGQLERRANELGAAFAVRFLGDQSGSTLTRLLRASLALLLPSRYRIAMDDAVIELARKAARPVVTTHGGPAHMVRHEQDGLVTYDNPGSMVWAIDRILGDAGHAERMGQAGRQSEGAAPRWGEVALQYLESCVHWFPELSETRLS